ncbi:MAG: hypothetical protein ACFE95_07040 [Candidatus Hodarchaeota archaeon]
MESEQKKDLNIFIKAWNAYIGGGGVICNDLWMILRKLQQKHNHLRAVQLGEDAEYQLRNYNDFVKAFEEIADKKGGCIPTLYEYYKIIRGEMPVRPRSGSRHGGLI